MDREDLIKFLKENLKVAVIYDNIDKDICVRLYLDDGFVTELISEDYEELY